MCVVRRPLVQGSGDKQVVPNGVGPDGAAVRGSGGPSGDPPGCGSSRADSGEDGSWDEPYFTGTGFPGYGIGQSPSRYFAPDDHGYQGAEMPAGFIINYHMYRNYWPLMALGWYRESIDGRAQSMRRLHPSKETGTLQARKAESAVDFAAH